MNTFIILPHQLFDIRHIPLAKYDIGKVILWEDPVFYGDRKGSLHGPSFLRLSKHRILYMRVAMRFYETHLRKHVPKTLEIIRIPLETIWAMPLHKRYDALSDNVVLFDPVDHLCMKRISKYVTNLTVLDTPNFLMTKNEIREFADKIDGKRLQHAPFFNHVKKKLHILEGVQNQDAENRVPYPLHAVSPPPPPFVNVTSSTRASCWKEETEWLQTQHQFARNHGHMEDLGYPCTHAEVRQWLDTFLHERFGLFGKYEDAVVSGEQWMYHSGLSIFLNMGLITPRDVVERVRLFFTKHKSVPLSSYEGFLRQLMGWREYARLYYIAVPTSQYKMNVFQHKKQTSRPGAEWYNATTANSLVNETIRDAFRYGYLHHIRRLMIMSNYMTLSNLHPDHVYAWMYEFSYDSYDWVMVFNVYSMGTWSDGGQAMRKPYISGASYLQRMARLKNKDDILDWNNKFQTFLQNQKEVLRHTQLAKLVKNL